MSSWVLCSCPVQKAVFSRFSNWSMAFAIFLVLPRQCSWNLAEGCKFRCPVYGWAPHKQLFSAFWPVVSCWSGLSRRAPKQHRPLWQLIISICHRWEPREYVVSPKNWPGLLWSKWEVSPWLYLVTSQIKSRWQKDGEPTFSLLGLPSCPWVNSPWCLLLVFLQILE